MAKVLKYDLVVRTKGRPPAWVPKAIRGWFIWDTSKRVQGVFPVPVGDGLSKSVKALGGELQFMVTPDLCLEVMAVYAGQEVPLVGYCVADGPLSVKGSVAGFSAQGVVELATV